MFDRKITRYFEKRDEEIRVRDERWDVEARRRDGEARRRDAEAKKRDDRWAAEAQRRDEEARESRERLDALVEETREFNREILLRNEKVYTSLIKQIEEGREQIRANTQAVLSVLDRLNGSSA
ncbi:MAG TPA: hypothetical protein VMR96_03515 [Solirubrobacterales bacterium]|nr:hypothetical protein [Solirubrobacterales bacterium]